MMHKTSTWLVAFGLLIPATTAHAQANQCRVPPSVSVPQITPDGPSKRLPVTGYSLSLSWSPEYCRGKEERSGDAMQCSGRSGRFGFVLHGLWPEGANGRWPQWCPTPRAPSPALVRQHRLTHRP